MPQSLSSTYTPSQILLHSKSLSGSLRRSEARQATKDVRERERGIVGEARERRERVQEEERRGSGGRPGGRPSSGGGNRELVRVASRTNMAVRKGIRMSGELDPRPSTASAPSSTSRLLSSSLSPLSPLSSGSPPFRKEADRSALMLAYSVRKHARTAAADVGALPGMGTARERAKEGVRETVRRMVGTVGTVGGRRPNTAGGEGRGFGEGRGIREGFGSRPSSAAPGSAFAASRRPLSPNRVDTTSPTPSFTSDDADGYADGYAGPPTPRFASYTDAKLAATLKTYNRTKKLSKMLSTLTVTHPSLGSHPIPLRKVLVLSRSIPPEPVPPTVVSSATHLHRLRMGYLTGEGHEFERDVEEGRRRARVRARMREKMEGKGGGGRPRTAGATGGGGKRVWKPGGGVQPAWRVRDVFKL